MSTTVIIGVALGILAAGMLIAMRNRYRDLFSAIFVFGIAALAVAVTIIRVQDYRENQAAVANSAGQNQQVSANGAPAGPPPQAPVIVPTPASPMMRGPTGGAAPEAAQNPYRRS